MPCRRNRTVTEGANDGAEAWPALSNKPKGDAHPHRPKPSRIGGSLGDESRSVMRRGRRFTEDAADSDAEGASTSTRAAASMPPRSGSRRADGPRSGRRAPAASAEPSRIGLTEPEYHFSLRAARRRPDVSRPMGTGSLRSASTMLPRRKRRQRGCAGGPGLAGKNRVRLADDDWLGRLRWSVPIAMWAPEVEEAMRRNNR